MSALDAVDGSSTGIARLQIAQKSGPQQMAGHRTSRTLSALAEDVRCGPLADIGASFQDVRFIAQNGHCAILPRRPRIC